MAMTIQKVFDANVYVGNESKHGQASEVTCPDVNFIMNEYNSLGMFGTAKYVNGIEAMEASIKWTYPDNEAQKALGSAFKPVDIMVRSSKAVYDNTGLVKEVPVVMYMRGYSTKHSGGSFTPRTDVEIESAIAVNYFKLEVEGEEIIEVDSENNIYNVGGEDQFAARKENLGI
jgi:P2 family phage contractile tail tube protein